MAFGSEIKRLRGVHNVSAQLLADAIGIDAERLRSWEKQDLNPRGDDTLLIEKYFGVPLNELVTFNSLPKVPNKQEVEAKKKQINTNSYQEPQPTTTNNTDMEQDYRLKYEQLLEKTNTQLSDALADMATVIRKLDKVEANIDQVKANLSDAAKKQQIFRSMSSANQRIVLETLARMQGLPPDVLVKNARSLGISLLALNEEVDTSVVLDNSDK